MDINSRTILLVDDSPVNLAVTVESLELAGYEVLVAIDGEEALERAQSTSPDLILLDIMMPGIDGFEVCRRLKTQACTQDIPVIFMTSMNGVSDKIEGFNAGAVDYVTKPFQISELRARIATHLKLRDLQRQLQDKNQKLQKEIDERKRMEEQLSRCEQEFLALSENSVDTIARYDSQCRRIYANPCFARHTGVQANALLGMTPSQQFSNFPQALDYENKLLEVYTTGIEGEFELTWPGQKKVITNHIRIIPERDSSGAVVSVLAIGCEISDRKIHESVLKDSAQLT